MKIVWGFVFASLFLVSLVLDAHVVKADSNNAITFSGGVSLFSPVNRTYASPNLPLNLTLACSTSGFNFSLTYDIDGKYSGSIPLVINPPQDWWSITTYGIGFVNLPELSEGKHRLTIYTEADEELYSRTEPFGAFKPKMTAADGGTIFYVSYADTVYFTIDSAPPNISILSPENNTTRLEVNMHKKAQC
jgi:hypothetical protein